MFDSLDVHTQPVATTIATANMATAPSTSSTNKTGGGGVFGDLVDLFGSNSNTASGLVTQTPQVIPQNVCISCPIVCHATFVVGSYHGFCRFSCYLKSFMPNFLLAY